MANLYGTVRGARINPSNDAEIFYFYRPSRSTDSPDFSGFKKLDSSYLEVAENEDGNVLGGMYNLRLPVDIFSNAGIYTIYIRPREFEVSLIDVSVLEAYPTVKGVVVNSNDVGGAVDLSGYRIEYYDTEGEYTGIARLITSSNSCEPVRVAVTDSYPKSTRYRLNNTTANSLLFCTVTPSVASSYRPNSVPYIGIPGQNVHIISTKFNPVMLEVELVEHDIETLTTAIEGDQVRNLDTGTITTYTAGTHEIYKQQEYYTLKSQNGTPLYDVKVDRSNNVDTTQSYDNIITE